MTITLPLWALVLLDVWYALAGLVLLMVFIGAGLTAWPTDRNDLTWRHYAVAFLFVLAWPVVLLAAGVVVAVQAITREGTEP